MLQTISEKSGISLKQQVKIYHPTGMEVWTEGGKGETEKLNGDERRGASDSVRG